jgi:rRNA-processing protein EBP2
MREENIPLIRPDDFFAEMLKSDKQMLKIKENLLNKKKEVERRELKQQKKEQKKYGKQIQQQKLKEKIQKKKQNLEAIKYWKTTQKGKEFDIKKLDEDSKLMEDNGIKDADSFKRFKTMKPNGAGKGKKMQKKRPGKSKRQRK